MRCTAEHCRYALVFFAGGAQQQCITTSYLSADAKRAALAVWPSSEYQWSVAAHSSADMPEQVGIVKLGSKRMSRDRSHPQCLSKLTCTRAAITAWAELGAAHHTVAKRYLTPYAPITAGLPVLIHANVRIVPHSKNLVGHSSCETARVPRRQS